MPHASGKRVVLVTGASRGLGRQIALRFGRAGERVVVNYLRNEAGALETVEEIAHAGGEAFSIRADVRVSTDVEAMVSGTIRRWGVVDVLVNNAGSTKDGLLLRMADESWNDVIAANLTGPFHCIRAAAAAMMTRRCGQIISIGSIVGIQGREGQANYAASKSGLMGLTRACARELGPYNIRVNAVLPGWTRTERVDQLLQSRAAQKGTSPEQEAEAITRQIPLGRMGVPDEFARAVVFLASPAASYITGISLPIDGGIIRASL